MGMTGPTGKGRGKRGIVAEINVTPLVDVMLVLLIIFMVTAPMMTQGLEVELPEATNKALPQEEEPLVVTIGKGGEISLKKEKVTLDGLIQQLQAMPPEKKKESIYIRGDKNASYGEVIETMDSIRRSGFEKVSIITIPPDKER